MVWDRVPCMAEMVTAYKCFSWRALRVVATWET